MIPEFELKALDEKIKTFSSFDKGFLELRAELWNIADKYNTDGPTVAMKFFDWKSKQE